jgi:dienelactone hydrolase
MRRLLTCLVVVLAANAGLVACGGNGGGGSARDSANAARRKGPFAIGARIETFVDSARGTPANGSAPARPNRTLETLIVYPSQGEPDPALVDSNVPQDLVDALGDRDPVTDAGTFPLVVFAHGFAGGTDSPIIQPLAAAGYVVAAPAFPLTNKNAPGGPSTADFLTEQPGDVSFVISQMLDLPSTDEDIAKIIDDEHVGVTGQSAGASSVLAVGFNSCCRDPEVDAAVAVAGGEDAYAGEFFTGAPVPVLVVHGTIDPAVPYREGEEVFADASAPKFFLTLEGAGHVKFDEPWFTISGKANIDFFDRYLKGEDDGLDRLRTDTEVPGKASLEEQAD